MSARAPDSAAPGIAAGLALSLLPALRCVPGWPEACAWGAQRPLAAIVLLLGAASLVVVPIGLWLRRATLRKGDSPDRAVALGVALSSLPLAFFGGVLKSTTHHRPLGGATFAVAACVVLALCIGLALRVGRDAAKAPWLQHSFSAFAGSSLVATLVLAAGASHLLLDFLILAAACAAAGLSKIPKRMARLPLPAVAAAWGLLLVGALFLTRDAQLVQDLRGRAPLSFAALSWLGGGS